MKTLLAIVICMAVLCGILGLLMCMASSMVSRKEEQLNSKYKEATMANVRKYGYLKPVKKMNNPIRWSPKRRPRKKGGC